MSRNHMRTDSTLFDTLTAVQQQVLQALIAGQSISAAAPAGRSDERRPAFTGPPSISGPKNTPTSPVSSSKLATTAPSAYSTNSPTWQSTLFDSY